MATRPPSATAARPPPRAAATHLAHGKALPGGHARARKTGQRKLEAATREARKAIARELAALYAELAVVQDARRAAHDKQLRRLHEELAEVCLTAHAQTRAVRADVADEFARQLDELRTELTVVRLRAAAAVATPPPEPRLAELRPVPQLVAESHPELAALREELVALQGELDENRS